MKTVYIVSFLLAHLISFSSWSHGDVHLKLPLYLACEQVDNMVNGWGRRHLFLFEKNGNENQIVMNGTLKSYAFAPVPPGMEKFAGVPEGTKETRSSEVQGQATFPVSHEDLFMINAMGSLDPKFDISPGWPFLIVGASVSIAQGELSKLHTMTDHGGYISESYHATCRQVTAEEIKKF